MAVAIENRPQLKEGIAWGEDLSVDALMVGDRFYSPGTRYRASTSGTVTKINRVNVLYEAMYFDRLLSLKTSKADLCPCYVQRGKVTHAMVRTLEGDPHA